MDLFCLKYSFVFVVVKHGSVEEWFSWKPLFSQGKAGRGALGGSIFTVVFVTLSMEIIGRKGQFMRNQQLKNLCIFSISLLRHRFLQEFGAGWEQRSDLMETNKSQGWNTSAVTQGKLWIVACGIPGDSWGKMKPCWNPGGTLWGDFVLLACSGNECLRQMSWSTILRDSS